MADKVTGKSRGFGFVYFADEKGLRSAIDGQHGTEWEGRRISVTRAIPQNETAPGTPASVLTGGRDGRPGRCAPSHSKLDTSLIKLVFVSSTRLFVSSTRHVDWVISCRCSCCPDPSFLLHLFQGEGWAIRPVWWRL